MIKVDFFFILFGLFIGFFIVYITSPGPKVIIKYPTIDNIHNTIYVDKNGICYKYYAKEVPCSNKYDYDINHKKKINNSDIEINNNSDDNSDDEFNSE